MGALYISVFNTEKNHGGIAIRCLLFPGLNGKEVYKGRNEANIAKITVTETPKANLFSLQPGARDDPKQASNDVNLID